MSKVSKILLALYLYLNCCCTHAEPIYGIGFYDENGYDESQSYLQIINNRTNDFLFNNLSNNYYYPLPQDDDGFIRNEVSNTDNSLTEDNVSYYSFTTKIILSTLATATSLITIGGNILVMLSFFLDRQIRNPTNYFLLSLSVSDFLIGLFSMPLYTLYIMLGVWPFGEIVCNLWLSLDYTVCLTSIYTVLFITIDRFCSVKIPAKYRKWRTRRKVIIMVVLTWVLPVSLFFTSIFAWNYSQRVQFNPKSCDVGWNEDKYFNIGLVISYFWTTLVVMIILYIFIYQVASNLERKSREKHRKMSSIVGHQPSGPPGVNSIVGVVALTVTTGTISKKVTPESIKQMLSDMDDDLYNTDSQSKASRNSFVRMKSSNGNNGHNKKPQQHLNCIEIEPDNRSTYNLSNKHQKSQQQQQSHMNRKVSNPDDEISSSYESHSDYDSRSHNKANSEKPNLKVNKTYSALEQQQQHPQSIKSTLDTLKPRPENLAVMSHDAFVEKCVSLRHSIVGKESSEPQSNTVNSTTVNETNGTSNKKIQITTITTEQIPFIDEEYDDLCYVLHKRQIDKNSNVQIGEETILIKSHKDSFIKKIQSPLRTFSRKCINSNTSTTATTATTPLAAKQDSLKIKSCLNTAKSETSTPIATSNNNSTNRKHLNSNNLHDSNSDKQKILPNNSSNKLMMNNNDDDSEDNYESNLSKSQSQFLSESGNSFKQKKQTNSANFLKQNIRNLIAAQQKFNINRNSNSNPLGNNQNEMVVGGLDAEKVARQKRKAKYENRARKALRTITFILGAFVFCFAPWHVVSVWNSFCNKCFFSNKIAYHIFNISYWMCYLNSPINPFMYALANQQFRKTFTRILKRDWRRL